MGTSAPVFGLRPTPFLRSRTSKTPKPRSSMRWPSKRASFIAPRIVLTALVAATDSRKRDDFSTGLGRPLNAAAGRRVLAEGKMRTVP